MKRLLFYSALLALTTLGQSRGQTPAPNRPNGYIQPGTIQPGYFLFPIQPGGANSLSGGLGDLRPNHFHAGLDIRTGAARGYRSMPLRMATCRALRCLPAATATSFS
ncbi:hypothetical protein [Spirosoma rhododendri]|uniref:hypothetical protein n=1 Tax=Spirosoma rhododendri TaxID=2728024 RepID=UPI002FCD7388